MRIVSLVPHATEICFALGLGDQVVGVTHECDWPPEAAQATPVTADVPALLLSGEFDPVTPPRYGDSVAQAWPGARHLVLKGQGHNVIGVGCTPKLAARFIDTLDAAELDATCLDSLNYTPPFAGHYGWEP